MKQTSSQPDYTTRLLDLLTSDRPLADTLEDLTLLIEKESTDMQASVLLLSSDKRHLLKGAAPNLPQFYNDAIHGIAIGDQVGSCGTAAFTGQRVIAEDINTHPFWKNFKDLALKAGLQACWSQPILQDGSVLGTFALYYSKPRAPTQADIELIEKAAQLAKVLIERANSRQQELLHSGIFENSPMGIMVFNDRAEMDSVNPAMETITGYSQEELLGKPPSSILSGQEEPALIEKIWRDVITNGYWQGSISSVKKNGEVYHVELTVSKIARGRGEKKYTATLIDVTAKQSAQNALVEKERLLELSLEAAQISYWDWRPDQGVFFFSSPQNLLGYSQEAFGYSYESWSSRVHPDDFEKGEALLEQCMNGDAERYHTEQRLLDSNGQYIWTQSTGRVVERDEEGNTVRMIGVLQNFDEIKTLTIEMDARVKQRTQELEEATKAAEAAAEIKSSFLANMSHEIRTPLNGIIGIADLMTDTSLSDQQRQYLNSLQLSASSLLAIINDVLDISKINEGKVKLELIPIEIRDFIRTLIFPYTLQVQDNITITSSVADNIPDWLISDPTRLHQIIGNLLNNAIKFTQQGTISLTLSLVSKTNNIIQLQFKVTDTGVGIAPEKLDRIFDKFEQADISTTRQYGGTGLGLAICKNLVEILDGNIRVDSEPGRGTCFYVTIPLTISQPLMGESHQITTQADYSQVRVLLAEDNLINEQVIKAMLNNLGVKFQCVKNGQECIARYCNQAQHFDIILMDCEMPVLDGYEATRKIRQWELSQGLPGIHICALTSHAMPEHIEKCFRAGMDEHLSKPVTQSSVEAMLTEFMLNHHTGT